jgi:hypothetical protein
MRLRDPAIGLDYFPRIRGQSHLSSPKVILKIFAELVSCIGDAKKTEGRAEGEGFESRSKEERGSETAAVVTLPSAPLRL